MVLGINDFRKREILRERERMEGRKQSSSSFTSDLFGAKDSSAAASSSGIFGSIFAPPAKIDIGREKLHSSETEKKHDSEYQALTAKTGVSGSFPDKNVLGSEGQSQNTTNKYVNPYNQEEKAQPFHYSSSIYYGGQDVYSRPQTAPNTCFTTFNKDGGEDESGGASRGNWWQGSLYY